MLLHVWQTLVAMRTGEQLHILLGCFLLRGTNGRGAGAAAEVAAGASSVAAHTIYALMSGNAS